MTDDRESRQKAFNAGVWTGLGVGLAVFALLLSVWVGPISDQPLPDPDEKLTAELLSAGIAFVAGYGAFRFVRSLLGDD